MSACSSRNKHYEVERQTALDIVGFLKVYELDHRDVRPTNLFQVFAGVGKHYPHFLHERFASYGAHAGFSNSFYEKYAFLPPGVTSRFVEGEILLLNAHPYSDPYGKLERNVISRATEGYKWRTLQEDTIQRMFKETGQRIPKPTPMPPPPPAPSMNTDAEESYPLSVRVERFFGQLAEGIGLGKEHWFTVLGTIGGQSGSTWWAIGVGNRGQL